MRIIFGNILTLLLLLACNGNNGQQMDNKSNTNQFDTKDSAVASVLRSMPQILSASQKTLYNLSDDQLKSLTPGKDIAVRYLSFDDIVNAKDTSLTGLVPNEPSALMIPLSINNSSRLFLTVKSDDKGWQVASIGNRKLIDVFRNPQNPDNNELLSVAGLEIDFLRKTQGSSQVEYVPLETNAKAGFTKDSSYSPVVTLQKLKAYATYLSREFGDKLKTGEIDR